MYILENENGVRKEVKDGFSWTMLFFGVFVPLVRGDWKWLIISFFTAFVTAGISWLVFPFFYNKLYRQDLLNSGYKIIKQPN